jgi:hypothetical protein
MPAAWHGTVPLLLPIQCRLDRTLRRETRIEVRLVTPTPPKRPGAPVLLRIQWSRDRAPVR